MPVDDDRESRSRSPNPARRFLRSPSGPRHDEDEGGGDDAQVVDQDLADFREKVPMDDRAWDFLIKADPEVQKVVVREFRVRDPNQEHYSALITGFVRKVANRLSRQGYHDTQDDRPSDAGPSNGGGSGWHRDNQYHEPDHHGYKKYEEPRERRGDWRSNDVRGHRSDDRGDRDDRRHDRHNQYHAERDRDRHHHRNRQEEVREAKRPPPWRRDLKEDSRETDNYRKHNGDNRGFRGGGNSMLEKFRQRYPMDDRAFSLLEQMTPHQQEKAINDFRPRREGENDYSALIVTFARSVKAREDRDQGDCEQERYHDDRSRRHTRERYRRRELSPLSKFRERYPIDDRAMASLRRYSPELQDIVITDFKPKREGEDDYSALVVAYARSRQQRLEAGHGHTRSRSPRR